MFDFTPVNYMYQSYENDFVLRDALRECKTEEEKEEVIRTYQGLSLLSLLATFLLAVLICGIISLFT
jgi:hypothetical protein